MSMCSPRQLNHNYIDGFAGDIMVDTKTIGPTGIHPKGKVTIIVTEDPFTRVGGGMSISIMVTIEWDIVILVVMVPLGMRSGVKGIMIGKGFGKRKGKGIEAGKGK
ncbi:hypothetical protein BGX38DRAFT_1265020 [Terfezia claveryi]|nr:hypothetical protein BGX38DRAFT_1265020 [Terfezia claveryi]